MSKGIISLSSNSSHFIRPKRETKITSLVSKPSKLFTQEKNSARSALECKHQCHFYSYEASNHIP